MLNFLSLDFWSDQASAAFNAWAILIAVILIFRIASQIKLAKTNKKLKALKAYTETIESRLQLARDELRQLINARKGAYRADKGSKGKPSLVQATLKEVDASAAALAMTNSATNHILTSEKLALGDLDQKHRLRLVPRPSSGGTLPTTRRFRQSKD